MLEAFSQMLWPLLACIVLVGIHAYLGIHVIARKVIFVDLALAQIAALGAVYGVFIGFSFEGEPWSIKAVSVSFTLLGAVLFAFTRTPDERVPHEAIIGIIYAAALSMTLLVTANLPHGADEVRQMLAGNILWVTPGEVIYTAILYGAVGVVHIIFRGQFFLLSNDIALRNPSTLNIKLWDFLFYATFGVVVTSSVGMGGVLLVFGYLVIPSVIGVMLAHSTKMRLLIGWTSGVVMSVFGVVVSYYLDLPSGPTIVVLLGGLLIFITLIQEIAGPSSRRIGLLHFFVVGSLVFLLLVLPVWMNRVLEKEHIEKKSRVHLLTHDGNTESQAESLRSSLSSRDVEEKTAALTTIKEKRLTELMPDVVPFLFSASDNERELAVSVLRTIGDERIRPSLVKALAQEKDVFIRIEIAQALMSLGSLVGIFTLQEIMTTSDSDFAKNDALLHLSEGLKNAPTAAAELDHWLLVNKAKLRFDKTEKKFYVDKQ